MQRQYKIFKISKNKVDFTLKKLNEKRNFIRITESVLAVEYDYMKNGYKKLLDDMSELSAMQYIITTSIFYKILICMVKTLIIILTKILVCIDYWICCNGIIMMRELI